MKGALFIAMLCCSCRAAPLVRVMTALTRTPTGWVRIEPTLRIDEHGAVMMPPGADIDAEDRDTPYMERLLRQHARQFFPVMLEAPCPSDPPPGTVWVLVHGIGGVGPEWLRVIPTLAQTQPAALYMYQWFAYSERGELLTELVGGIERLAQCWPDHPIVVLGHSAGGVLGAFAASRLELGDPPHPVLIITVASPLAGVGARPEIPDAEDDTHFFNDLGAVRRGYPAAAPGVTVLHLRTQWPADSVMKPNLGGYAPNAASVRVKGARVVDLPATLHHDDSLWYVARELAAGRLP